MNRSPVPMSSAIVVASPQSAPLTQAADRLPEIQSICVLRPSTTRVVSPVP